MPNPDTTVYLIVCINTESEISYIDPMIANVFLLLPHLHQFEMKVHDYMDQRSRQSQFDLDDATLVELSESKPTQFSFQLRYSHCRVKFQETLLQDLEALLEKENEYLSYLENCSTGIEVRGFF